MYRLLAAVSTAAFLTGVGTSAEAQISNPATPIVGSPVRRDAAGPPAPPRTVVPVPVRTGPVPPRLTLAQALEEAAARSPAVAAARAEVAAAEGRARQAGYRTNPELSLEVENFAGTGELKGLRRTETTLSVNQRLDLSGRRSARVRVAGAQLEIQRVRLAIAQADVGQEVRQQFARAVAAHERLAQAQDNVAWAKELARVTGILVDAGREPPLRATRARSALAQAEAALEAARAQEIASRTTLGSMFGVSAPVEAVVEGPLDYKPTTINVDQSLEVRLANAERDAAAAELEQQLAERRLDPAVGVGVRHLRETGDVGLVAGISMPLRVFDRNQGNIAAAQSNLTAAEARRVSALAGVTARGRNAIANVEAAHRRLSALSGSALPEAREVLRLAQFAYEQGKVSLLELIDAQNSYIATQASLTEAELALAEATAELARIAAQQEKP